MQTKFRTLLSTTAALAAAMLLASASAHAQIKLRYAHVGVANAPQTLYADEVARYDELLAPMTVDAAAAALSISRRSSEVSSTATAPRFSSRRYSFVVPGMGTIQGF